MFKWIRDDIAQHLWTKWELVEGQKNMQVRRCTRCGLYERRPTAVTLFEVPQPACTAAVCQEPNGNTVTG